MVHQELAFCENLSVAENLCLGDLPRARALFVSRAEMERRARAMLDAIEAPIDVRRLVGELTVAEQQMVQIAAAVGSGARVIIFDEPTSSLSQHEAEHLYALIDRLKARGVTCIYVSHRMPEIFRLCDTITVLRDGRHVATKPIGELDEAALVQLMIGRRLDEYLPDDTPMAGGGEVLRVDGAVPARASSPTSAFSVRAGEVVGIAGLVGAGRSDIAQALFGLDPEAHGRVEVAGIPLGLRLARRGDARRRRLRARGSQAPGAGAEHARARERHAADAASARARRLDPRRRASGRWRPTRSRGCACARPISTP